MDLSNTELRCSALPRHCWAVLTLTERQAGDVLDLQTETAEASQISWTTTRATAIHRRTIPARAAQHDIRASNRPPRSVPQGQCERSSHQPSRAGRHPAPRNATHGAA